MNYTFKVLFNGAITIENAEDRRDAIRKAYKLLRERSNGDFTFLICDEDEVMEI